MSELAVTAIPQVPWQITGNHWLAIPCVHPSDGSIHAIGAVAQGLRGAVEVAGGPDFLGGSAPPLLALAVGVDGTPIELSATRMAWQRVSDWLPTFNASAGSVVVRGTIFAPFGRLSDAAGFIYAVSLENRDAQPHTFTVGARGTAGACTRRVRTARPCGGGFDAGVSGDTITIAVRDPAVPLALAIAGEEMHPSANSAGAAASWELTRQITLAPGERIDTAFYCAVAPEGDGALASLSVLREIGWRDLAESTRAAVEALHQTTGVPAADRIVNRNLVFAYFYGVARGIDDARWYVVRTRAPWNSRGMTVRDWDALMWTVPAVQLADPELGREVLVRVCELHGYAPGRGVNYIDGTPFEPGFSTAAAAAYALAIDRYIAQTGDDRVVEEGPVADSLYASYEDIASRRDASVALYATERTASGKRPRHPYVLHTNAVVATALDVLRQTLDEKTAEKIEEGEVVRAAARRHLALDRDTARAALAVSADLRGEFALDDDPVESVYWLPVYQMFGRDDSLYRRTVRRVDTASSDASLAARCARLVGPDATTTLDWLRRAALDNGIAAECVSADGSAAAGGGDAALSGLVAYTVWYAVTVLGVTP